MITDQQARRLRRLDVQGVPKEQAAIRTGMDPKTARTYRRLGRLPSEVKRMDREWLTRPDAFADVWPQLEEQLRLHPRLEAKTLLADLRRRFPGRFSDRQLRTLQRRAKQGPAEPEPGQGGVFSPVRHPARLCGSPLTPRTRLWRPLH